MTHISEFYGLMFSFPPSQSCLDIFQATALERQPKPKIAGLNLTLSAWSGSVLQVSSY